MIVDDNSSILGALRLLLERHFAKVTTLTSPKLLDTVLRGEAVDAVLLDMNFTAGVNNGNEGIYWLRRIRDIRPDVKDRKSTRLNSSHNRESRMPSSA